MPFHLPDLVIILIIGLLIFGPKKLPEISKSLGRSIKAFNQSIKEPDPPEVIPSPKQDDNDLEYLTVKRFEAIEREILIKNHPN